MRVYMTQSTVSGCIADLKALRAGLYKDPLAGCAGSHLSRLVPERSRTLRHAWPLLTSAARLPRPGWPYATRRTVAPRHTTIGPARRPTHSSGLALAATSRPTTHSDETAGWLPAEDAWATMQPSVHPA